MVDSSQISLLLGGASRNASTISPLFSQNDTIATVTQSFLENKYNIEQPASTASFSDELKSFIANNVSEAKAEALLADLTALENFNGLGESEYSPTTALLGDDNSVLDLLA